MRNTLAWVLPIAIALAISYLYLDLVFYDPTLYWLKIVAETLGPKLTTLGVALTIAAIGWNRIRSVARARTAFDLIVDKEVANLNNLRSVMLLVSGGLDIRCVARNQPTAIETCDSTPEEWNDSLELKRLPIIHQQYTMISGALNWYEALAIAIHTGIADEKTVRRFLEPRLKHFATILWGFIDERRTITRDKGLWKEYIALVKNWGWKEPDQIS